MATIINGTNMVLKIDDAASPAADYSGCIAIAAATSATINITTDTGEVTDKSSGDRKEFIGLSTSWTCDCEVFYNEDGTTNPLTLFPRMYGDATTSQNGVAQYPTKVLVEFDGGANEYRGEAFITSMNLTGGTEDAGTYSVSMQGTGVLAVV
tara:strand:- start:681 stop:1136 length:456 start_codon:yes stop_codon:yes gene_type:complete